MNYVIRELTLYRHFLLIDSPIPFEFIANPTNYNKDMSDYSRVTGLDVCSRPSGCWRVDCWKLLPKEFQRNNPVFTMLLKYDADLLGEGEIVDVRYSDIDVGEGIAGVNGQLVDISPNTFRPVIKSIDALQTSNHVDLGSVKTSVDSFKSDLLNGVEGVSDPLHFYLDENLKFTKEIRSVVSPVAVGIDASWSRFVTDVPYDGWVCVYTPVSMPLVIRFMEKGVELQYVIGYFKAGINTFKFHTYHGEQGDKESWAVSSIDCEGVSVVHLGPGLEHREVSAVIHCHPVDVYLN